MSIGHAQVCNSCASACRFYTHTHCLLELDLKMRALVACFQRSCVMDGGDRHDATFKYPARTM